jgi:hypothetical protein
MTARTAVPTNGGIRHRHSCLHPCAPGPATNGLIASISSSSLPAASVRPANANSAVASSADRGLLR